MIRPGSVALFTLAACSGFGVAGEDAETYEVSWREHWAVGQVVTVTEHDAGDTVMTVNGKPFRSEHDAFDATYVLRCDALDEKGASAKRTLFVKSWKNTKGDQTDESIAGARIVVIGKEWTLPEGRTAGPLAKKWLDQKFARDSDDPLTKLAPPRLAVGQVWRPDPKAAAEAFAKSLDDMPIDVAKIEMEVTLASVEGTPPDASGRFLIKVHIPFSGESPGLPPGAVVMPGSTADVVGARSGPLTTATMLGTEHLEMSMVATMEIPKAGQKTALSTKATTVHDKKVVSGGEIPEAPAPSATKPAVPEGK